MIEQTQRRLAAIVSADVVGYSRLMGVDETGTLAALRAHRAEMIDAKIAEHGGRIVKTMGDGLLLEFPSVVNATACAVQMQESMALRNAEVAEDQRIVFRIGVNLGDIIIEGDDILGDGVNIAARIEALAEPGGVAIAGRVYEDVRDRLDPPKRHGSAAYRRSWSAPPVLALLDVTSSDGDDDATSFDATAATAAARHALPRPCVSREISIDITTANVQAEKTTEPSPISSAVCKIAVERLLVAACSLIIAICAVTNMIGAASNVPRRIVSDT